jgi:hypothetical protein
MGLDADHQKIIISGGRMKKLKFRLERDEYQQFVKPVHVDLPKKMTGKEALSASIQKWEFILENLKPDTVTEVIGDGGTDSCGLCDKFQYAAERACETCPVKLASGKTYCGGTPFVKYWRVTEKMLNLLHAKKPVSKALIKSQRAAATEELEFLKSLKVK